MPYLTPYVPSVTPPEPPDSDKVISGSPEGVVTASVGAQRLDGDTNTLYFKETGDNTNTGWVAVSGGGGGISGLTTGTIPKAASSTSLTDSPITVVGNDITVAGNITAGGSAAGQVVLGDGGANTITLKTQTISSNINWILPAAPATGFLLGTDSGGDVTLSHVGSLGTGNVVRASQIDDTAYNATTWNGVTDKAPSMNAVRDKIESMGASGYVYPVQFSTVGATITATTYYFGPNSGLNATQGRRVVAAPITGTIIGYAIHIRTGATTTAPTGNTIDIWKNNAQVAGGQYAFTWVASTTTAVYQATTPTAVTSGDLLEIRAIFGGSPSSAALDGLHFQIMISVP